jgi:hypothetical protein
VDTAKAQLANDAADIHGDVYQKKIKRGWPMMLQTSIEMCTRKNALQELN